MGASSAKHVDGPDLYDYPMESSANHVDGPNLTDYLYDYPAAFGLELRSNNAELKQYSLTKDIGPHLEKNRKYKGPIFWDDKQPSLLRKALSSK